MGNGAQSQEPRINCFYHVRGYCYHRGSPCLRCTSEYAITCEQYSKDTASYIFWKERYWKLMQALREKVGR